MKVKPRTPPEGGLWLLTVAPTVWAAHLMLCYLTAAIWCARYAARDDALGDIRTAIAWYTAVALIAIAIIGWEGFRRHSTESARPSPASSAASYGTETNTSDLDSPEDRQRFLGFATLLLSGLSAVAVLYAALAAVYFDTCR